MACACKNKLERIEKITQVDYNNDDHSFKTLTKQFLIVILLFLLKLLFLVGVICFLPITLLLVIGRVLFFPHKKIIINLDKVLKRWTKTSE